jgi:hypothetical protein
MNTGRPACTAETHLTVPFTATKIEVIVSHHPTSTRRTASSWTPERIRALGAVTDIATAGQILGLSRSTAYALAADDTFPVPGLRIGSGYRVPVAALLAALHIPLSPAAGGHPPAAT